MAEVTDLLSRASSGNNTAIMTTVAEDRSAGELILSCVDLTNWATDTPVFFSTFKIDPSTNDVMGGSQTNWKGVVNPDNNTITDLSNDSDTPDQGNDLGDYVLCLPTARWANDIVKALQVVLNPDGTPKAAPASQLLYEVFGNHTVKGGVYTQILGSTRGTISACTVNIQGTIVEIPETGVTARGSNTTTYVIAKSDSTYIFTVASTLPTIPEDQVLVNTIVTDATNGQKSTPKQQILVRSQNVDFTTFPKIQYGGGNLSGNTTTRKFTPSCSGLLVVKSHSRRNQSGAADNVMDISISGATGVIVYAGIGYGTTDAFASAQALATVAAGTPVTITMTATNPANSGYTFFVIPGTTELFL